MTAHLILALSARCNEPEARSPLCAHLWPVEESVCDTMPFSAPVLHNYSAIEFHYKEEELENSPAPKKYLTVSPSHLLVYNMIKIQGRSSRSGQVCLLLSWRVPTRNRFPLSTL